MGWNVYYLGQGVPIFNIKKVIDIADPELLMTMFVTPKVNKINAIIDELLEGNNVKLMISGSTENIMAVPDSERIVKVNSPDDFQNHLTKIHSDTN